MCRESLDVLLDVIKSIHGAAPVRWRPAVEAHMCRGKRLSARCGHTFHPGPGPGLKLGTQDEGPLVGRALVRRPSEPLVPCCHGHGACEDIFFSRCRSRSRLPAPRTCARGGCPRGHRTRWTMWTGWTWLRTHLKPGEAMQKTGMNIRYRYHCHLPRAWRLPTRSFHARYDHFHFSRLAALVNPCGA